MLCLCKNLPGAEETQQCKDAAAEHVSFLEEKAEQEAAAHEAALSDIQNQLSAAR